MSTYEQDGEDLLAWWAMERHRQEHTAEDRNICLMVAADGASRMLEWSGTPPPVIRVAMRAPIRATMYAEGEDVTPHMPACRVREYEQGCVSQEDGRWVYREIVE